MSTWLRWVVVWMLALAIPVQGIAAATMQFCAPSTAGPWPASAAAPAGTHAHHGRDAAAMAAHQHGHEAGAHPDAPAPPHDGSPSTVKCSACAACCMATALPARALTVAAVEPAIETAVVAAVGYTAPDVAGLERPPKHLA